MKTAKQFLQEKGICWDPKKVPGELEELLEEKLALAYLEALESKKEENLIRATNWLKQEIYAKTRCWRVESVEKFLGSVSSTLESEMIPEKMFYDNLFHYCLGKSVVIELDASRLQALGFRCYENHILSLYPEYKVKKIFNPEQVKKDYFIKITNRLAHECDRLKEEIDALVNKEFLHLLAQNIIANKQKTKER